MLVSRCSPSGSKSYHLAPDVTGDEGDGDEGNDCMELVARLDADTGTQELILDDLMGGFLFKLFNEKWDKFGRKRYIYSMVVWHASYVVPLTSMAFWLKVPD